MAPSTLLPPSLYRSPDPAVQRARIEKAAQVYERWRLINLAGPKDSDYPAARRELVASEVELWHAVTDTRSNHADVGNVRYIADGCGEVERRVLGRPKLHPASDSQRLPRIYKTWPAGARVV